MPVSVKMPQLGESVTEGTITRWLKNVGDHVTADEPLVEISTDKVDTEIPSPATGILLSQSAQEDDVVEVGAELALIGEESEAGAWMLVCCFSSSRPICHLQEGNASFTQLKISQD